MAGARLGDQGKGKASRLSRRRYSCACKGLRGGGTISGGGGSEGESLFLLSEKSPGGPMRSSRRVTPNMASLISGQGFFPGKRRISIQRSRTFLIDTSPASLVSTHKGKLR